MTRVSVKKNQLLWGAKNIHLSQSHIFYPAPLNETLKWSTPQRSVNVTGDLLKNDDPLKAVKSKNSLVNIPLDIIKFDAFFKALEKDQVTGIVEITTSQGVLTIFLKKGNPLKCFMGDKEASIFEVEPLKGKGTISLYQIDAQVLDLMALFAGAEPKEILSAEYADIKKFLQIKERDHFSGIVEFFEKGDKGFLRLENGEPQNGIFISGSDISLFSDALAKIIDESRNFKIRSYEVTMLNPETAHTILTHTVLSVHHKVDPRTLLTKFEQFTPENAEEIAFIQIHPRQDELFIVKNAQEVIGLEYVYQTREYTFVHWVLHDLFLQLAETVENYTYLWYWIPECTTVEFKKKESGFSFDIVFKTKNGDLLMQNALGEILFVATFLDHVSKKDVSEYIKKIEQFKKKRSENGDVGAAFLVGNTIDKDAVLVADTVTQTALYDKLTGLKGFYRISNKAGFHLVLVEGDPFTMVFPKR